MLQSVRSRAEVPSSVDKTKLRVFLVLASRAVFIDDVFRPVANPLLKEPDV